MEGNERGLDMTNSQHTPTPWRSDRRASYRVVAGEDDTVATTGHQSNLHDQWQSNAVFIVRAVNAHEALVEALERLLVAADQISLDANSGQADEAIYNAIAALKLAKGEA